MKNKRLNLVFLCLIFLPCQNSFAANWLYTVRPGDTLWDLCQRYTKKPDCWYKLDKVNGVKYPRRLPPGFVVSFPVDWLTTVPTPVEVSFVDGDVSVRLQQSVEFQAVSVGDKLPIGAHIVTAQGNVNLLFADGTTMQLEPGSELILDTLSAVDGVGIVDSRLRLNRGAVKTRVIERKPASRFQITTPTAVAAVRGTQYRVSSIVGERPLMRGEVFEGLVAVNANNMQQGVAAGFGIVAKQGEPLSEPRALLPAPVFTMGEAVQSVPAVISWQGLVGAQSYQLEILQDNDKEELIERTELKTVEYEVESLETGCYQLRIRAIDNEQLQGMAGQQKLCIAASLAIPELHTDNITYQARYAATLTWPPVDGAVEYRYQIASDRSFNNLLSEGRVGLPQIDLAGTEPLFIRVRVIGQGGQLTAFSDALQWQPDTSRWAAVIMFGLLVLVIL